MRGLALGIFGLVTPPSPAQHGSLRPGQQSLRLWLGASYGLLVVLVTLATLGLIDRSASAEIRRQAELGLEAQARALASRIDGQLDARLQDMRLLASLPLHRLDGDSTRERRAILERVQSALPDYAWIGEVDRTGRVLSATGGLLEGVDVSARPWFRASLEKDFLGDVHEARLLEPLLAPEAGGEPLRFLDVAVPLRDEAGEVSGVVGGHLHWHWARRMLHGGTGADASMRGREVYLLGAGGRVLYPERADAMHAVSGLEDAARTRIGSDRHGSLGVVDADGRRHLAGFARLAASNARHGAIDWVVFVREPEDVALTGLQSHRRGAIALGIALSVLAILAALLIAQWISDPLHGLAEAMSALRTGDGSASGIDAVGGYREVRELASTLSALVRELAGREAELQALAGALESRVADRTRELELANAALEQLSLTDPLTGLGNRRFFDEQLARELDAARGTGRPLALLCLDIDHFKAINDRHGHPVGDKVLVLIARHLRDGLRPLDILARTGGEEFCVVAPRTDLPGAMALAERLRAALEAASPLVIGRDRIEVRLSGGVAMLGDVPEGLPVEVLAQRLYDRADQALYLAKHAGRNRIRYSSDTLA